MRNLLLSSGTCAGHHHTHTRTNERRNNMPRRNRRDPQHAYALPEFCGICGTTRDLKLRGGQRLCHSCHVLETRRRADPVR